MSSSDPRAPDAADNERGDTKTMTTTNDDTRGPREIAYDTEIAPLMTQIIATCKRVGIPVAATFELDDKGEAGPLACTTTLVGANAGERLRRVAREMVARRDFAAFTITTKPVTCRGCASVLQGGAAALGICLDCAATPVPS